MEDSLKQRYETIILDHLGILRKAKKESPMVDNVILKLVKLNGAGIDSSMMIAKSEN
jgi:hypothetical protein